MLWRRTSRTFTRESAPTCTAAGKESAGNARRTSTFALERLSLIGRGVDCAVLSRYWLRSRQSTSRLALSSTWKP